MPPSLHLLVCQYYLKEAQVILQSEGFENVSVSAFPDLCVRPRADLTATLTHQFYDSGKNGQTTILVGACYLLHQNKTALPEDRYHRIHREELCFHMLINKTTIDRCLCDGSHLVTSGWLEHWQQHIDAWQFDRDTARMFFAEGARRMVLLDTGVDPEAHTRLHDCAEYLGLPTEVMSVGLDHFRLILSYLVQAWRTREAEQQAKEEFTRANKKLADHVLAMDLLVKLTRIMNEEDAIQAILELFTMLFGAERVAYVSPDGGQTKRIYSNFPKPDDAEWIEAWLARFRPDETSAMTESGFSVRVKYQNATLGFVIADTITLPHHGQDYLNLALDIVSLCALSLTNARLISLRQQAEAEVFRKSEELARSNAELDQFAYIASHDLQAPLRRIIGFSELLREECAAALPDTARDFLSHIEKSSQRMQQLIQGLLMYARMNKGDRVFFPVALSNPVHQALEDLAPRMKETGATVEVGILPMVLGDPLQLYQLFQNLIGNALKFVAPGCAPRVCVSSRSPGKGLIEIRIRDNGIGFDEKLVEQIFKPFQRLHSEDQYPGSGIGLAVCQKIVQQHGGTITAQSQPGAGTTFLIRLPEYQPGGSAHS
jgi:signal transduction histidine kinase